VTEKKYDPTQTHGTFTSLLAELEEFMDTSGLELTFDRERNVFLCGPEFREQLTADPMLRREIKNQMREILAKYRGKQSQQP